MAKFHFDVMKQLFPEPGFLTMAYTDTDSFIYKIVTNNRDLYKIMKENKQHFDFSDYPPNHPCYSTENKKVLAKFKENGMIISEFVGLRPKMYAYRFHENRKEACKKAKSVKSNIILSNLTFENYLSVLKGEQINIVQYNIQSKNHKIYTLCQRKLALSGLDNKRFVLSNAVDSLPWGHSSIPLDIDQSFLFRSNLLQMIPYASEVSEDEEEELVQNC